MNMLLRFAVCGALLCLAGRALAAPAVASDPTEIRAGSELDFRPYCFTDKSGQPAGLGPELLKAVADKMALRMRITPGPWDQVWDALVAGQLDVLPIVARTPGREPLVDFCLPHTETFDAFFRRTGQPPLPNLAAAAGKQIVVLHSDAAHHELIERKFAGKVIPVPSIAEGLRLIASGQHDAFLCSKLIGVLERQQAGIKGVEPGPPIPDYKRVFSFAVRKGNAQLREKLNQGLSIAKADGTYDRIYRRWLTVEDPWRNWLPYFQGTVVALALLAGLVVMLQWLVRRRTRELATEVAERRRAEAALKDLNATLETRVAERTAEARASEERFRRIARAGQIGFFEWNASKDISFWSPEHYELFGYEPGSLITWERWLASVHPDDRQRVAQNAARLLEQGRATEPGQLHKDEYRFMGSDGSVRWLESEVSLERVDGEAIVRGAVRDITARRQAEEALRDSEHRIQQALRVSRSFTFEWEPATDRVLRSASCGEILGLTGDEAVNDTAQNYFQRIQPDDRARFLQMLQALGPATKTYTTEYRVVCGDGRLAVLEETGAATFDTTGQLKRLVGVTTDITERKQAEEALRASEERLRLALAAAEAASKAKDAFIAALSHELRTPLTPVVASLSSLAADGRLPEDLREDLAMIQRNIGLEVHLINDLLDVSRIVSGKLQLTCRVIDLATVVRDVGHMLSGSLEAGSQRLVLDLPMAGGLVNGDAARLHQVFWNLLRNAIKFSADRGEIRVYMQSSPPGPGSLFGGSAGTAPVATDHGHVTIQVCDDGRGIAADDLPRLFRAFEQGGNAHGFGGLGLGLAICRGIVEAHGGTIGATSAGPGRGATFTVNLPLAASAMDLEPQARPPAAHGRPHALRILLVEDHPDTSKLMSRLLAAEGHTVTCTARVADALKLAAESEFDVLMSDLGLPDASGYELMRRLRAAGQRLPGIAVSGHGSEADIHKSLEAGFAEHLTKPISFDALGQALLRVTGDLFTRT
jgi:PAS domain S-box-containing protein